MKKYFFVAVFSLLGIQSFSQSFTLSELIALCNKSNWDDVNEYLVRKGWEYHKSSKGDDEHYSTITWAYHLNESTERAQAWFYLYAHDDNPGKLEFSFSNASTYSAIKAALTAQGAKFLGSSVEDDEIIAKYATATYLLNLATTKIEGSRGSYEGAVTSYSLTVLKRGSTYDQDNGLKKIYDDDGNLEAEVALRDGKLHGLSKSYYPNGMPKVKSMFVNGKKQGTVKEYDEEGRLEKEYEVRDEVMNGSYINYYYHEGELLLKEVGKYANDQRVGQWFLFNVRDNKTLPLQVHNYLNGELNGTFKEIKGDSIIFGSYKNGVLHGGYKVYISLNRLLLGGIATGDTTRGAVLTSAGCYFNGQKDGYWKEYSITNTLVSEGAYVADEKDGEWKYYYENFMEDKGEKEAPYAQKLYLIENYVWGKLNGKATRFSYLERKEVPCDTLEHKEANPMDTCYRMVFEALKEVAYYKNGVLHGPVEIYDSTGLLKHKGTFVNGEKEGTWIEGYNNDGLIDYVNLYLYQKGNYSEGKRVGVWEEYLTEGKVETRMNYKDGVLDGKIALLDSTGKATTVLELADDYVISVDVFDSLRLNVIRSYRVLDESSTEFRFQETETSDKGKTATEYLVHKEDADPFPFRHFEIRLIFLVGKLGDGKKGYKDGPYKEYNKNNLLVCEGNYSKGAKEGIWNYYNNNSKLIKSENYQNGVLH